MKRNYKNEKKNLLASSIKEMYYIHWLNISFYEHLRATIWYTSVHFSWKQTHVGLIAGDASAVSETK